MNRRFALIVVLALVVLGSTLADAQVIRPRGSATKVEPTVMAPATPAAPAPTVKEEASAPDPHDKEIADLQTQLRNFAQENTTYASQIHEANVALDKMTKVVNESYALRTLILVGVVMFLLGGLIGWRFTRRAKTSKPQKPIDSPNDNERDAVRRSLGALSLILIVASVASATPKAPDCTIRAITNGAVIVKEQDPAKIAFTVRNCGEVSAVSAMADEANASTEIVFTEVTTKSNTVTAKVAATATALTGPTSFKLTLADGTEVASPDAIYLLILDTQTAQVRKDLATDNAKAIVATAKVAKELEAVKAEVATRPTTSDVTALVTKTQNLFEQRLVAFEAEITKLKEQAVDNSIDIKVLGKATRTLAEGQVALGETVVKKGGFLGFGGKKALNPEVAESAKLVQQAVTPR